MVNILTDRLVLSDYPNRLIEPTSSSRPLPLRPLLLAVLFILCLLPRALFDVHCAGICPDATLYIKLAQSMEAGQWHTDGISLQLAAYPAVIWGLHSLGFDWESGAIFWGILLSSLAVLPLFGWMRRQFDDRVALAGCFLYAVHQRFVEWSPSIIRDQTFWFLFALAIYLLWRAVQEVRPGMFAAAGIVTGLSVTMRLEGIFLLIPFAIWTFYRWRALRENRGRLAIGAVLGFMISPAALFFAWIVLFYGQASGGAGILLEILPLRKWQTSIEGSLDALITEDEAVPGDGAPADGGTPSVGPPSVGPPSVGPDYIPHMSLGNLFWEYARSLESGITAVYGLLMFGGIWHWRRVWARSDNQPLFYVALLIMAGILLDFSYGQQDCQRYPLPVVLISLPFAGMALLEASGRLRDSARRRGLHVRWQLLALAAPTIVIAAVNYCETSSRRYAIWESYENLGRWMREDYGGSASVAGHEAIVKIAAYYGDGSCFSFPRIWGPGKIVGILKDNQFNYLFLSKREMTRYDTGGLMAELQRLGYRTVEPARLPSGTDKVLVMERKPADSKK